MTNNEVMDLFDVATGLHSFFSPALYHRYDTVERVYLDAFDLEGFDLFLYLLEYIEARLEPILKNSFYVCLTVPSDTDNNEFERLEKAEFKKFSLQIPADAAYRNEYVEEEEWYVHYLLFKESSLKK